MRKVDAYKNRFPHTCKVYRLVGENEFTDGEVEVIYEGECSVYSNSNMRMFAERNVEKADFAVDIPKLIKGIGGACYIDAEDYNRTYERQLVLKPQPVQYGEREGTTLYFNIADN